MTRLLGALLACLLVTMPAFAGECLNEAPWVVYGQTQPIYNGAIDNPPSNSNGIVGEASVPYSVPIGRYLELTGAVGEAYAGVSEGLVYAPYIGSTPPTSNSVFLFSLYADNATNEVRSIRYRIPAGKVLNLRIMSKESPAQVVGWALTGRLCDAQ